MILLYELLTFSCVIAIDDILINSYSKSLVMNHLYLYYHDFSSIAYLSWGMSNYLEKYALEIFVTYILYNSSTHFV